jgi:hypothetical protein
MASLCEKYHSPVSKYVKQDEINVGSIKRDKDFCIKNKQVDAATMGRENGLSL